MRTELEVLLEQLLPDYTKESSPVISEMFRIFLEYLDETSHQKVINLSSLVDHIENVDRKESQKFTYDAEPKINKTNTNLKKVFVELFLNNINEFFNTIKNDNEISKKLEDYSNLLGLDKNVLFDLESVNFNISTDILNSSKAFNQNKGTAAPFEFLSNLLKPYRLDEGVSPSDGINVYDYIDPNTNEPVPLKYVVESSMFEEVYKKAFKPITHPLGYEVLYIRLLTNFVEDYYGLSVEDYGYEVKLIKRNGKTITWKDEVDETGNVSNQQIKSFKSKINLYNNEELEILFNSGEKLYTTDKDIIYYDKDKIPHKYNLDFYSVEYTLQKRITVLTKDAVGYETHSNSVDNYDYEYISQDKSVLTIRGVHEESLILDYIYDESTILDVKEYNEISIDTYYDDYTEMFEPPEETYDAEYIVELNYPSPSIIGVGAIGGESEELFWVLDSLSLKSYQKVLKEQEEKLANAEMMYNAYSDREGRRTYDVPKLEGNELLSAIKYWKHQIYDIKNYIGGVNINIQKFSSGLDFDKLELFYDIEDTFDMDDFDVTTQEPTVIDDFIVDDKITYVEMDLDFTKVGFVVGKNTVSSTNPVPVGNEDTMFTYDDASIYSYDINDNLLDVVIFNEDDFTLESETIVKYNQEISDLNDSIENTEYLINNATGYWSYWYRSRYRYYRYRYIRERDIKQQELDNILVKYQ